MAQNAGILAIDAFFPNQYIEQSDLEQYDNVSAGKYTIGLGQQQMAFCTPAQDIYSLALSAVKRFMTKYSLSYDNIGRLEVGTETIIDHSKSIKSVLMQLFVENGGNTDIEGIDCTNACYGGTNALFNSLNWLESSAWDSRCAMVVCGDIAEYASGPARPTGGAGIVVVLLGQNAPLVVDQKTRSTHMEHVYDFYKPHLSSPFPVVDGALSQTCYLQSLDICYQRFITKYKAKYGKDFIFVGDDDITLTDNTEVTTKNKSDVDYFVFHAPYNKLVQKSYARLFYLNAILQKDVGYNNHVVQKLIADNVNYTPEQPNVLPGEAQKDAEYAKSLTCRNLEKTLVTMSKPTYSTKVTPTVMLPTRLGNLYTASIYAGLLSLINEVKTEDLVGKNLCLFSYGSGLAASFFTIAVQNTAESAAQIEVIKAASDIKNRLDTRIQTTPQVMSEALQEREATHKMDYEDYAPVVDLAVIQSGEYYLVSKDKKGKRQYQVKE